MAGRDEGYVWHWAKRRGAWHPIEVWHERVGESPVHNVATDYDEIVDEWGPRIPTPDEPVAPRDESKPPPGWEAYGPCEAYRPSLCRLLAKAWRIYDAEHGYAPPRAASPEGPGGDE